MENQQQSGSGRRKPWGAFNIVNRGEKSYWNRIGTAYHNHDGSMNIILECLPRDGKVQIREQTDREKEKGALAEQAEEIV